MNIAAYARISHEEAGKLCKNALSDSIDNQMTFIQDYVERIPDVIKERYIDDGYSGTDFNRPDIKRMFDDIEHGYIDCVIVKDLSRLGRNYVMTGYLIEHYFPDKNVRFISINDNVDTWEKDDEMLVFRNVFNDWYAKDISKKIRSAKYSRAVSGKRVNNVAPYGYKTCTEDKSFGLIVNEGQADVVRMIFDEFVNGESVRSICSRLSKKEVLSPRYSKMYGAVYINDIKTVIRDEDKKIICSWSSKTIYDILKREEYIGNTISLRRSRISYKNHKEINNPASKVLKFYKTHEKIVDESIFMRVDEMMRKRMK